VISTDSAPSTAGTSAATTAPKSTSSTIRITGDDSPSARRRPLSVMSWKVA
jgi:hypothetical protein